MSVRMNPWAMPVMAAVAASVMVSACAGSATPGLELAGSPAATGSITTADAGQSGGQSGSQSASQTGSQSGGKPGTRAASLPALAKAHAAKPDDRAAAVAYARALKGAGKLRESVAILERLPDAQSKPLLIERGLMALELGETAKARELLAKTEPESNKDWRVLSALGVAEASSGNQAKAQGYFKQALQISPSNPVVQNNLALSLILEKKVTQGEALLKTAARQGEARPTVGQNLALASALTKDGAAVAQ